MKDLGGRGWAPLSLAQDSHPEATTSPHLYLVSHPGVPCLGLELGGRLGKQEKKESPLSLPLMLPLMPGVIVGQSSSPPLLFPQPQFPLVLSPVMVVNFVILTGLRNPQGTKKAPFWVCP